MTTTATPAANRPPKPAPKEAIKEPSMVKQKDMIAGNYERLASATAMGRKVAPSIGEFRDGLWMTSFESSFFLESRQVRMQTFNRRIRLVQAA